MASYLSLQSLQEKKKTEKNYSTLLRHINNKNPSCGNKEMFIGGHLEGDEINALHELVINHCPKGDIVEIGSWLGLSTVILAMSLKERYHQPLYKLHAIDPQVSFSDLETDPSLTNPQLIEPLQLLKDTGRDHHEVYLPATKEGWTWYDVFNDNLSKWEVEDYIEKYREYSHLLDVEKNNINNIAMLWVDGDHMPDAVLQDLIKYAPLVVDGGFIAMHDMHLPGGPPAALEQFCHLQSIKLVDYEEKLNLNSSTPRMGIFRKDNY